MAEASPDAHDFTFWLKPISCPFASAHSSRYARVIHKAFCCSLQLHAISSRARSLRFDVLQVRLQGNSLCLA